MAEESIVIQVEPQIAGLRPQTKTGAFAEITEEHLAKVQQLIERVSRHLAGTIKHDELTPKELEVEFGVGFKGDARIPFLAKAGVETNFKVTARWDWREGK